ncbi:peptidase M48 [Iodidimonas nitroreducens]|uniref:Peptidase M48 n=1 Tax=Iodidimonas nitroreducens TaxID=1236968 RepID=A0A5A7NA85_9PROT|nr:M48 family metallopeptidase [Iodidimonas nitroreducens]GAK32543.1 mitochondrial metalloendopeptidase OMA1 [alpha proteobacterium Q-1]GER04565.1 peptidase M48 [Iodidimonas nitroreducens]
MGMKRLVPASFLLIFLLVSCTTAPVTGRRQLILVSEEQSTALGVASYQQIKEQLPVVANTPEARMVERIGIAMAKVVEGAEGFAWEFTLFKDETPNAFALPGGKVGVNTGLFQVAKTEVQLATVMGHEIAHVMAQHSAERMSRDMATQLGLAVLGASTGSQEMVAMVSGVATLGVALPFNRSQESEADRIGLIYMAKAGYDPHAAVDLWTNFAALGGERPPKFLSTHPLPEDRIERIQALIPEAMAYYQP